MEVLTADDITSGKFNEGVPVTVEWEVGVGIERWQALVEGEIYICDKTFVDAFLDENNVRNSLGISSESEVIKVYHFRVVNKGLVSIAAESRSDVDGETKTWGVKPAN